jgi:tRNA pseudouridine38-40 synthase
VTLFDVADPEPGPEAAPDLGPAEAPGADEAVSIETERLRLVLAYDGGPFHGFAVNEGVTTVAGVLTEALRTVLGHDVVLTCAGRTDKGVHARAQVVTFDAPVGSADPARLVRSLNRLCAPSIAITAAEVVAGDFDARFSATARRYRYLVHNAPTPDPFLVDRAWHVERPLNLDAMVLACDPFIGEHDFAAFCRRPKRRDGEPASLVRRVTEARWADDGDGLLRFEIEASSFCHQMVRSVVGTIVEVGLGRRRPGDLLGVIRSGDRDRAGDLAPPQGLTLWTVRYGTWSSANVRPTWPG